MVRSLGFYSYCNGLPLHNGLAIELRLHALVGEAGEVTSIRRPLGAQKKVTGEVMKKSTESVACVCHGKPESAQEASEEEVDTK